VIGVPPGEAVGRAHAVADAVEDAIERAVPGADVVVHVEPRDDDDQDLADRVLASAHAVPRVREVHNVRILHVGGRVEATMHLKLPPDTPLGEAGAVASEVDAAMTRDIPQVSAVRTHLEPLDAAGQGEELSDARDTEAAVRDVVAAVCGQAPHDVRLVGTGDGVVAFVTLSLGDAVTLEQAHDTGGAVRRRIRTEVPGVVDAFVEARP
jgi:divalent metal cation (Fe/Co/Zn/Cd) transporter